MKEVGLISILVVMSVGAFVLAGVIKLFTGIWDIKLEVKVTYKRANY